MSREIAIAGSKPKTPTAANIATSIPSFNDGNLYHGLRVGYPIPTGFKIGPVLKGSQPVTPSSVIPSA